MARSPNALLQVSAPCGCFSPSWWPYIPGSLICMPPPAHLVPSYLVGATMSHWLGLLDDSTSKNGYCNAQTKDNMLIKYSICNWTLRQIFARGKNYLLCHNISAMSLDSTNYSSNLIWFKEGNHLTTCSSHWMVIHSASENYCLLIMCHFMISRDLRAGSTIRIFSIWPVMNCCTAHWESTFGVQNDHRCVREKQWWGWSFKGLQSRLVPYHMEV
jgi:hypothetical protein